VCDEFASAGSSQILSHAKASWNFFGSLEHPPNTLQMLFAVENRLVPQGFKVGLGIFQTNADSQ